MVQKMTNQGPVNLTELEKARRTGKVGEAIGIGLVLLVMAGLGGLLVWGLITLIIVHPVIGWTTVGFLGFIALVSWAVAVCKKAEEMEEDAKKYGVVDD